MTGEKLKLWIHEERLAKIFFWLLAAVSLVASVLLLRQQKPEWKVVLGLLIWAGICVVLAIGGVALVRRIHRIGPGGVEIETWQEIGRILSATAPPLAASELRAKGPWTKTRFTPQQSWFYEKATSILIHLQHRGIDLDTLSKENLNRYRQLILWVGAAAINKGDIWKAFEILKLLEPIESKTPKELFWLGASYFWAGLTESDAKKKRELLETACLLLQEASQKDTKNADLWWTLGWIYDELGLYSESIDANKKAVDLNPKYAPWAFWTMAVSFLKQKKLDPAIEALRSIERGPWWEEIHNDPELAALKADPRYVALYDERKNG
jgi:tetratricopeptide (TPR) repeat protein